MPVRVSWNRFRHPVCEPRPVHQNDHNGKWLHHRAPAKNGPRNKPGRLAPLGQAQGFRAMRHLCCNQLLPRDLPQRLAFIIYREGGPTTCHRYKICLCACFLKIRMKRQTDHVDEQTKAGRINDAENRPPPPYFPLSADISRGLLTVKRETSVRSAGAERSECYARSRPI